MLSFLLNLLFEIIHCELLFKSDIIAVLES